MSRKSSMHVTGTCPFCTVEAVRITRASQEDPWQAVCSGCGTIWEYVTIQTRNGNHEILAGDGEITVSLGIRKDGIHARG